MIDDMEEAHDLDQAMRQRMPGVEDQKRRWLIAAAWWLNVRLRLFVLPVFIMGATGGLILSEPLQSYILVLNGMAITFVTTLDDTLCNIMIHNYEDKEGNPDISKTP